ncbi:MAG: hypothetical protein ACRETY_06335 [Steroidobacteraceae bacterium]
MKVHMQCSTSSIVWLLLATAVCSCSAAEQDASVEFLSQPMIARRTAILEYSPEEQVKLYLKAMIEKHPPDLALANALASNGSKIVPALLERLVEDGSDVAKMHLIDVFVRMQDLGYYAVVDDNHTMKILEQQASAIKDPQWKRKSSDLVERIQARKQ